MLLEKPLVQAEKVARWALLSLACVIAGCASPPPTVAYDKRPNGNAGTSVKDMSADTWIFEKSSDPMTGSSGYSSSIWSVTTVELPYPYQGSQRLTLQVGRNAKGYSYAVVGIPRGQFSCYKCDVRIKFDNGDSRILTADASLEMSGFLFIAGESYFIEQLRNSKRVMIEVPFFNSAKQVVTFKSEGFPW